MIHRPRGMVGLTAAYAALFISRRGDRADWCFGPEGAHWCGGGCTTAHWHRARRPIDPQRLRMALESWPVSLYFLDESARTHLAAFDVDGDDSLPKARELVRVASSRGLRPVTEWSGTGAHLWFPIAGRITAEVARRGILALRQQAGFDLDAAVEVRPSTDHGLGGTLRAPGTVSPKSGRRTVLADLHGVPLGADLADAVTRIEPIALVAWQQIASTYVAPPPPPQPARRQAPIGGSRIAQFKAEHGVTELLEQLGARNARPGRAVRCPLHGDRNPSLSISRDDGRAWCHSPSCELYRDGRGVDAWDLARLVNGAVAHQAGAVA